ncbi:hypothetical protein ACLB2K_034697 [Fragaria x ananassa]
MAAWFSTAFRWLEELDLSLPSAGSFRWPGVFDFSYFTTGWNLNFSSFRIWFNFSIVDDVLWTLVTVVESLALAAMLCFFFLFCGCLLQFGRESNELPLL